MSTKQQNAQIAKQATDLYKRYETAVEKYKTLQGDIAVKLQKRTRLDTTKNENALLMNELALLEDDAVVYKKSGPILVRIENEEAKTDVQAKIRIIADQIQQIDTQMKNMETRSQTEQRKLTEMQQKLQALQQQLQLQAK